MYRHFHAFLRRISMKKRISDANLVAIMFGCIIVSLVIIMIADIIETAPQYELHLVTSHKLVTVQVERQKEINAELYLLGSGNVKTTESTIYRYCYQREDGGIVPVSVNLSDYKPNTVFIVVYEDDTVEPKVEYWTNYKDKFDSLSGSFQIQDEIKYVTEIRFTIPKGSFVNVYDFQELTTGNSK